MTKPTNYWKSLADKALNAGKKGATDRLVKALTPVADVVRKAAEKEFGTPPSGNFDVPFKHRQLTGETLKSYNNAYKKALLSFLNEQKEVSKELSDVLTLLKQRIRHPKDLDGLLILAQRGVFCVATETDTQEKYAFDFSDLKNSFDQPWFRSEFLSQRTAWTEYFLHCASLERDDFFEALNEITTDYCVTPFEETLDTHISNLGCALNVNPTDKRNIIINLMHLHRVLAEKLPIEYDAFLKLLPISNQQALFWEVMNNDSLVDLLYDQVIGLRRAESGHAKFKDLLSGFGFSERISTYQALIKTICKVETINISNDLFEKLLQLADQNPNTFETFFKVNGWLDLINTFFGDESNKLYLAIPGIEDFTVKTVKQYIDKNEELPLPFAFKESFRAAITLARNELEQLDREKKALAASMPAALSTLADEVVPPEPTSDNSSTKGDSLPSSANSSPQNTVADYSDMQQPPSNETSTSTPPVSTTAAAQPKRSFWQKHKYALIAGAIGFSIVAALLLTAATIFTLGSIHLISVPVGFGLLTGLATAALKGAGATTVSSALAEGVAAGGTALGSTAILASGLGTGAIIGHQVDIANRDHTEADEPVSDAPTPEPVAPKEDDSDTENRSPSPHH